jgi:hypothetical protein
MVPGTRTRGAITRATTKGKYEKYTIFSAVNGLLGPRNLDAHGREEMNIDPPYYEISSVSRHCEGSA